MPEDPPGTVRVWPQNSVTPSRSWETENASVSIQFIIMCLYSVIISLIRTHNSPGDLNTLT